MLTGLESCVRKAAGLADNFADTASAAGKALSRGYHGAAQAVGLEDEEPSTLRKALPYAAGLGVASLGGLGAYKYLRRFNPSRTSAAVRGIQEATKDLPVTISGLESEKPLLEWLGGVNFLPKAPSSSIKTPARGAVVAYDYDHAGTGGETYSAPNATIPDVGINYGAMPRYMSDKAQFFHFMKAHDLEHLLPKQNTLAALEDAARAQGQSLFRAGPQGEATFDSDLAKKLLGHEGDILIKPSIGARSKVDDFWQSKKHQTNDPRFAAMAADPNSYLVQEHLPIKHEYRLHTLDDEMVELLHRRSPSERPRLERLWDRITKALGAQAGGAAMPVLDPQERANARTFVKDNLSKITWGPDPRWQPDPRYPDRLPPPAEHLHAGWDLAKLEDGSYRLIEANPAPATHVQKPFVAQRLQRAITGRWSPQVAALGAGAAGVPLGLAAAKALATKDDE